MFAKNFMHFVPKPQSKLMVNVFCTISKPYEKSSHVQWISADRCSVNSSRFFHNNSPRLYKVQGVGDKLKPAKGIQENISALQIKKRPLRKKKIVLDDDETPPPGVSFKNLTSDSCFLVC